MNTAQETNHMPEPYTPTPDGFERRLRAWVRLPTDDVTAADAGGKASTPPKAPDARGHT
jgi:hypothetical protein